MVNVSTYVLKVKLFPEFLVDLSNLSTQENDQLPSLLLCQGQTDLVNFKFCKQSRLKFEFKLSLNLHGGHRFILKLEAQGIDSCPGGAMYLLMC